jgi:MtN3 and saliva related transmembrane protein
MQVEQIIGIAAGILTGTSMLPQLIKLIKEKKADAISPVMLIVLLCGLTLWVVYGIIRKDWPIIITNAFSWCVNLTLLILRQVYKGKRR